MVCTLISLSGSTEIRGIEHYLYYWLAFGNMFNSVEQGIVWQIIRSWYFVPFFWIFFLLILVFANFRHEVAITDAHRF